MYYVRVEASRGGTGAYTLHAEIATDDHGDLRSDASELVLGKPVAGSIEFDGDRDVFRLELGAAAVVRIFTSGGLNTVGRLEQHSGEVLALEASGGEDRNFLIVKKLEAGVYYVRVRAIAGWTGDYTLHAEEEVVTDDHGDSLSDATELELGRPVGGEIDFSGDDDVFRLELAAATVVRIFSTGGLFAVGFLENRYGQELVVQLGGGEGNNFLILRKLEAGVYYVRVRGRGGVETGAYTLHAEAEIIADDLTIDPNPASISETRHFNNIRDMVAVRLQGDNPPTAPVTVTASHEERKASLRRSVTFPVNSLVRYIPITWLEWCCARLSQDLNFTVTFTSSSSDSNYDGLTASLPVTVNAWKVGSPGFTANIQINHERTGLPYSDAYDKFFMHEGQTLDLVDLQLFGAVAPTSEVTVTLTGLESTELQSTSLTFGPSNYDLSQTMQVTVLEDADAVDDIVPVGLRFSSADPNYNRDYPFFFNIIALDNDRSHGIKPDPEYGGGHHAFGSRFSEPFVRVEMPSGQTAKATITNYSGNWYYKKLVSGSPACHSATGSEVTLDGSTLLGGLRGRFMAYSDSSCSIQLAMFHVPGQAGNSLITLFASSITHNSATISIWGHTGDWYLQTSESSCSSAITGSSTELTGLSPETDYFYTAYSDSDCSDRLHFIDFWTRIAPPT